MAELIASRPAQSRDERHYYWPILGLLVIVATVLTWLRIQTELHGDGLWNTLWHTNRNDVHQLLVRDSLLPRVAITLVCGAALALAGTLAQQVLRNPLAEPMTLGVLPGAYLAVSTAAIWAPALLDTHKQWVALVGGSIAIALVFLLAWTQRMSSLAVILSGMVVNLLCGAVSLALAWTHYEMLHGLMIWGGGALEQSGWSTCLWLALRVLLLMVPVWLLRRPLALFETSDATAQSLGISVQWLRFIALLVTVTLAAFVVAAVGVIGFIGLAAPIIAKLAGARRMGQRLWYAPLLGALLLWATDEMAQCASGSALFSAHLIPTGTVTSLLGVPFLIAMLPRLRSTPDATPTHPVRMPTRLMPWSIPLWLLLGVVTFGLSIFVSRGLEGWRLLTHFPHALLMLWRLPHTAAAMASGALLALSGTLLQRLTANPMASPDLLGVSSGATLGMVVMLFTFNLMAPAALLGSCVLGALATLGLLLWLGKSSGFAPERLLLIGVAISALFQSVVGAIAASGDARYSFLMNLLLGNTYFVTPLAAYVAVSVALVAILVVPLLARWLQALELGAPFAGSVGVPVVKARLAVLLFASVVTAVATVIVGPMSFIGLMAPHLARFSGARRPAMQAWMAALIGATLMGFSEWLGRMVMFPEMMPTGLMTTLVGVGYFVITLFRRKR